MFSGPELQLMVPLKARNLNDLDLMKIEQSFRRMAPVLICIHLEFKIGFTNPA